MRRATFVFLLAAAYAYGAISHEHRWFPTAEIERGLRQALWHFRGERGFNDPSGRAPVDCHSFDKPRTAILLTLGQSNAASEGEGGYVPGPGVFNLNFLDGRCYVARDPLLGTTGNGGSPWTRLADKLIASGHYDQVLIVPIAVGGTGIARWAKGGDLHPRIARAEAALRSAGLHATHVLWHQGENDARRMAKDEYVQQFGSVLQGLRDAGIDAPVFVAVATICGNRGSDAIRAAQREIPRRFANVLAGPDTDRIDRLRWRRDGCHFSAEGLDHHAEAWRRVIAGDPEPPEAAD